MVRRRWHRGRRLASLRPDVAARLAVRPAARAAPSQPAAAHPAGGLISSGGQRQASESLAIVADRHHGGLRRCPRLTAGVHLAIVQLLVCCAAARRACRLPGSACRSGQGCCGRRRRGPGGRHSPLAMHAAAASESPADHHCTPPARACLSREGSGPLSPPLRVA